MQNTTPTSPCTASNASERQKKSSNMRPVPDHPPKQSNNESDAVQPTWHPRKLKTKISRPPGEAGRPSGCRGFSLKQKLQLDNGLYHSIRVYSNSNPSV